MDYVLCDIFILETQQPRKPVGLWGGGKIGKDELIQRTRVMSDEWYGREARPHNSRFLRKCLTESTGSITCE